MINDNLTQYSKPGYNFIKHEECNNLTIEFNYRHGLGPLSKVVYGHDNVLMPPTEVGLKSTPHLVKGPMVMTGWRGVGCEFIF
jgi:hypothetical protein